VQTKDMNVLLLFLLLQTVIGFAFCDIDTASEIQCPGLKERAIFPQPGKIQLGTDYKVWPSKFFM
jgi:hypothetical protein